MQVFISAAKNRGPQAGLPAWGGSRGPRAGLPAWGGKVGRALALAAVLGAVGCATENKVLQTPYFTLHHPDFWKVKSVGSKPGEPTVVTIGQYGSSTINEGSGSTDSSMYESSQAEVEVRTFAWPEPAGGDPSANPTERVSQLLFQNPELELNKHGLVPPQQSECGKEFQRKYNFVGAEQAPYDLLKRPGWRTIIVGGKAPGLLLGVVSRVPFEQDAGLYCHNLSNMRTQLGLFLDGVQPVPQQNAPQPAAPATPSAPTPPPPAPAPAGSVPSGPG